MVVFSVSGNGSVSVSVSVSVNVNISGGWSVLVGFCFCGGGRYSFS